MEKKISYTVQESDDSRTVEFLLKHKLGLSKAQIRSAKFRQQGICINGQQTRVTGLVQAGDFLEAFLEREEDAGQEMEATEGALDILYEDEDIILLNKAAGVAVHPGHGHFKDTLANHLLYYFYQQKKNVTIRAVGRLDKDTSGIVVFAKNKVAAARLTGRMKKEYLALVLGHLDEKSGCIELSIKKKKGVLNQMEIAENGSFARTHYQVLGEYKDCSMVKLHLDTGRTHQIRIHMAAVGHPLLGDPIYGKKQENDICRAALHCARIELRQPFTGEIIIQEVPVPMDMRRAIKERNEGKE